MAVAIKNRSTKLALIRRQKLLQKILDDNSQYSILYGGVNDIIQKMREAGFKDYNHRMYYRDKTDLNKNSTYILDLAQFNYSAYVEEINDDLTFVEEQALAMYRQEWNQDKTIIKNIVVNNEIVQVEEHHKTAPNATPKLKALEILTNAQKLKMQLISGDTLNVSAALVGRRMVELENDVNRLEKLVPKSKTNVIIKKLEEEEEEDNSEKQ